MDFHVVDIIIVSLILFLAIKGLVNGFTKELFNFIALIGGIAVAARMHGVVGEFINQNIFPIANTDAQKLAGFMAILLSIWIILNMISSIMSKFSIEEPSVMSRLFGYLISLARYLFIIALIIFGVKNSQYFEDNLSQYYKDSQLFTPLSQIGSTLLNMESNSTHQDNNESTKTPFEEYNLSEDINESME